MADALIRFLVKSHLATVESEDLGDGPSAIRSRQMDRLTYGPGAGNWTAHA